MKLSALISCFYFSSFLLISVGLSVVKVIPTYVTSPPPRPFSFRDSVAFRSCSILAEDEFEEDEEEY